MARRRESHALRDQRARAQGRLSVEAGHPGDGTLTLACMCLRCAWAAAQGRLDGFMCGKCQLAQAEPAIE